MVARNSLPEEMVELNHEGWQGTGRRRPEVAAAREGGAKGGLVFWGRGGAVGAGNVECVTGGGHEMSLETRRSSNAR